MGRNNSLIYHIMTRSLTLFLIIFLEGYAVLSTELLAIRLLIPYTGSGTETISIIIAAVLMPLAFGYYAGGQFKSRKNGRHKKTVRKKLLFNLLTAAFILTAGLSYTVLRWLFENPAFAGLANNRITLTTIYALVFLVYPVFLLGQTVPLISNYFPRTRLPVFAGKIMFFSTLGAFMGAVFCTLVLMNFAGVHYTAVVTIGSLAVLVILLSRRAAAPETLAAVACVLLALALNNDAMMARHNIVANNQYHTVQIENYGDNRLLKLNHNFSAGINKKSGEAAFDYIRYMERVFIDPLIHRNTPADILVLGAGGFVLGKADPKNNYIYVDIDRGLKDIAESKFLQEKLGANKHFEAAPARAFLAQSNKKFDLILIDMFHGPANTPAHLVTREFYQQIKNALKPGGIMAANYLLSPNFSDPYTVRIDNTIRSVFKIVNRHTITSYDAWDKSPASTNVIYSVYHYADIPAGIYTDNKNRALFDKP